MDELVKIVAKYFIVLSALGVLLVFVRMPKQDRLRFLALLVVGGAMSVLLAKLGSLLYNDPRPFVQGHFTPLLPHAADNGFPSDHTLLAGFLAWAALYYSRKIGALLLVVAVLVGLARMAAGVHHLADIVGSLAISALGAWLAWLLVTWVVKRRGGKDAPDTTA